MPTDQCQAATPPRYTPPAGPFSPCEQPEGVEKGPYLAGVDQFSGKPLGRKDPTVKLLLD